LRFRRNAPRCCERDFDLPDMVEVFNDPRGLDFPDLRLEYGVERSVAVGAM
jgi:uncharacterized DUF497 family protein